MKPEIIRAFVEGLTDHEEDTILDDHEVWDETDGGAHFMVSRPRINVPGVGEMATIGLTVSGEPVERARIIAEFIAVLGEPEEKEVAPDDPTNIDTVLWLEGVY